MRILNPESKQIRPMSGRGSEVPATVLSQPEIKLRAERRAGELLRVMERQKQGGDRKSNSHDDSLISPSLSDLGITWSQSSRWQKIAAILRSVLLKIYGVTIVVISACELRDNLTPIGVIPANERQARKSEATGGPRRAFEEVIRYKVGPISGG